MRTPRWTKTECFLALVLWGEAALLLRAQDLGPWRETAILAAAGAALLSALAWPVLQGARRGALSGFQVAMLLSLLVHVAAGYLMGSWVIARTLQGTSEPEMEIPLDSEALAQENLAVRIREEIAPLEVPDRAAVLAVSEPALPENDAEPVVAAPGVAPAPPFPVPPLELRASAPDLPEERTERTVRLPSLQIVAVDAQMERRELSASPKEISPVDPPLPALASVPPARPDGSDRPRAEMLPWAESSAPAGRASAIGAPKAAELSDAGPAVRLPALPPLPRPGSAREERPPAYVLRDPARRKGMIEKLGGDDKTEQAVVRALEWLQRHQEADGRWSIARHGGRPGHDAAATGFALLCFYGWGARHDQPGPWQETLRKGVTWLCARTSADGDLTGGDSHGMYDQGIATLALAEAYGMTRDEQVRVPLQRAVDLILKAQNREHGGWRYRPGSKDGDTSVLGWQVMALRSAELAGLPIPADVWTRAGGWLDWVGGGRHGGLYGYRSPTPKPAMVAQGMFCRQLMGAGREGARMEESAASLLANLPDARRTDYYCWYAGSLALYQHQGPAWTRWNSALREILLGSQVREGEHAGSWDARGAWGDSCGRVVTTALATLSLEVYYRYLPFK